MLIRPCHRVLKAINYLCSQDNSQTTSNLDLMIFFHQKLKDLDLFDTIATATGSKNDFKMTSFAAIHLYSE